MQGPQFCFERAFDTSQSEAVLPAGAVQTEHSSIDHKIIEVCVLMLTTILCLHEAYAGLIFRLNTCTSSFHVQSFAERGIGDALLQRGNHADIQHIALYVRQLYLSTASDNHDVPSDGRSCDDVAHGLLYAGFCG